MFSTTSVVFVETPPTVEVSETLEYTTITLFNPRQRTQGELKLLVAQVSDIESQLAAGLRAAADRLDKGREDSAA